MHRARIAAGPKSGGGSAPVPEKRGYLPMVSVTPPVHQKPGKRIPPMSQ